MNRKFVFVALTLCISLMAFVGCSSVNPLYLDQNIKVNGPLVENEYAVKIDGVIGSTTSNIIEVLDVGTKLKNKEISVPEGLIIIERAQEKAGTAIETLNQIAEPTNHSEQKSQLMIALTDLEIVLGKCVDVLSVDSTKQEIEDLMTEVTSQLVKIQSCGL